MTTRTPDFYVVKRTHLGTPEYWSEEFERWFSSKADRTNYENVACAKSDAFGMDGARVVPVYCTTRKSEPKMRERSSSWVLKRLAEGKVVVSKSDDNTDFFYRFSQNALCIEVEYGSGWERSVQMVCFDRTTKVMLCRIARPSEVPQ